VERIAQFFIGKPICVIAFQLESGKIGFAGSRADFFFINNLRAGGCGKSRKNPAKNPPRT
jgi:hypothetical protein